LGQPLDGKREEEEVIVVVIEVRQGAVEKIKQENDVHLRQLAKKSTYVPFFFLVRFWAFLGKGSSKTRKTFLSTFQKKTPGKYFFGGGFFFWMNLFNSYSFRLFGCVG
jgi:hypothetical protein